MIQRKKKGGEGRTNPLPELAPSELVFAVLAHVEDEAKLGDGQGDQVHNTEDLLAHIRNEGLRVRTRHQPLLTTLSP